jgi:cell division protein FtsL
LKWNWDSASWKKSNKLLLLFATFWPVIYMFLFFGIIVSAMLLSVWAENKNQNICAQLDVLQLDRRIRAGEIRRLTVRQFDVIAAERTHDCNYQTRITDDSTRNELLADANELVDGHPRVDQITEEKESPVPPPLALGTGLSFIVLMVVHLGTIVLMMALMPYYIILAVKNERLDQTGRIIWVVLLCTIGILANPVYWYLYVWRKPTANPENDLSASSTGANTRTA